MKKVILFFLLLTTIAPSAGIAKISRYVELGINVSKFRTEKYKSLIGPSFGIGFEYFPIKKFDIFLVFGINYQRKKFILENRTWRSDPYYDLSDIEIGDINVDISYIEIPFSIGYSINLKNGYKSSIFAGYSFSIPISYHTKISNQKTIMLEPEEKRVYNFDYIPLDENYTTGSENFHFGVRLSYKQFALMFIYTRAISITEGVSSLSAQDKIDFLKISGAFLF